VPALRGSALLGRATHSTIVGAVVESVVQDDTDCAAPLVSTPGYMTEANGLETFACSRSDALGAVAREGDGLE
jgi:hypothetical protein